MNRIVSRQSVRARSVLMSLVVGACLVAMTAAPAAALTTYTIQTGSGLYITGTTSVFNRYMSHDDEVADVTLPFPVSVYGVQYRTAHVSTNGNVQFGSSRSTSYTNTCLPSSTFVGGPMIAPYWDDLIIRPYPAPDGIFTKTTGTAPYRTFAISWRGVDYATSLTAVRAEVVFREGSKNFSMIFADGDGSSATIGAQQGSYGPATQFACSPGHPIVVPGQQLTFVAK
jgi:hypothetical protein